MCSTFRYVKQCVRRPMNTKRWTISNTMMTCTLVFFQSVWMSSTTNEHCGRCRWCPVFVLRSTDWKCKTTKQRQALECCVKWSLSVGLSLKFSCSSYFIWMTWKLWFSGFFFLILVIFTHTHTHPLLPFTQILLHVCQLSDTFRLRLLRDEPPISRRWRPESFHQQIHTRSSKDPCWQPIYF